MTIGAFDFNAFDNTGFWTGDTAAGTAPIGAGGGGAAASRKRQDAAAIAPFIRWGKKKRPKKPEQIEEVISAIKQVEQAKPIGVPSEDYYKLIADRMLMERHIADLRRTQAEIFAAYADEVMRELDDEDVLLLTVH